MNKRNLIHIQELIDTERGWGGSVGELSDGYHTFDELYEHRIELFKFACRTYKALQWELGNSDDRVVWKAEAHHDGSKMEGWFIMGLNHEPGRTITYHLPMRQWNQCSFARTLDVAVEWDGHTADDVLKRLKTYKTYNYDNKTSTGNQSK